MQVMKIRWQHKKAKLSVPELGFICLIGSRCCGLPGKLLCMRWENVRRRDNLCVHYMKDNFHEHLKVLNPIGQAR